MIVKLFSNKKKFLEWLGVATAILYAILVAFNIGLEVFAFFLLLISALLIGLWSYLNKHQGILLLQIFYGTAAIIGMINWL